MNGIPRGADASSERELRTVRDGKPWASFPMAVDAKADGEAPATVGAGGAVLGDAVAAVAPRLTKSAEVYCDGRLTLGTWKGRDGEARAGLNLRGVGRCSRWGRSDGGTPRSAAL